MYRTLRRFPLSLKQSIHLTVGVCECVSYQETHYKSCKLSYVQPSYSSSLFSLLSLYLYSSFILRRFKHKQGRQVDSFSKTMDPSDIAIVGLSFKLPQGAEDESSFWEILQSGRNVMTSWPQSRAVGESLYGPESNKGNKVCSPNLSHYPP